MTDFGRGARIVGKMNRGKGAGLSRKGLALGAGTLVLSAGFGLAGLGLVSPLPVWAQTADLGGDFALGTPETQSAPPVAAVQTFGLSRMYGALAALSNAAVVVGRELSSLRVVVSGAGAAGVAVTKILLRGGVSDVQTFGERLHATLAGVAIGALAPEVGRRHCPCDAQLVPHMAARNDFGRAVLLGGVVNRPERADAERRPRPRYPCAAVVGVPGLHGLFGMQIDREQRRQQPGTRRGPSRTARAVQSCV